MMNTNNPADRLRIIRKSKGWSLQDVERHSNGKWKAVVIGSYERSDRAISLKKAIALMQFYQVPVTELFPDLPTQSISSSITFDLNRLSSSPDQGGQEVSRLAKSICNRRKDWNGQVLTIRSNDLQFLALLLEKSESKTLEYLTEMNLIKS